MFSFSEEGDNVFDAPFVAVHLVGTGLAVFTALRWQSFFQTIVELWDEPKQEREEKIRKTHPLLKSFIVAVGSTILALIIAFVMFKFYSAYHKKHFSGRSSSGSCKR